MLACPGGAFRSQEGYSGQVEVFSGSASGPVVAGWVYGSAYPTQPMFGASIALEDVNGDGAADLIVGSPTMSNGSKSPGAVLIYYGSQNNFGLSPGLPSVTLWGENTGDQFGSSASGVGDVNGEFIGDLLVGAPFYAPGGKAYLYYGGAMTGGVVTTAAGSQTGTQSLVIGAPYYSSMGRTCDGAAFFYVVPPGSLPVLTYMVAMGASAST